MRTVSFSGIDGAGKSTQIEQLTAFLSEAGCRVQVLRFWDDIAVLGSLRELSTHKIFKSEGGIGTPERPVNRQDKNVTAWYMVPVRYFLYLLDAVYLAFVVARMRMRHRSDGRHFVIFDRYLYDELANLPLQGLFTRLYVRALLALSPRPDIVYLLDADPVQARARKPEYPVEFLHKNRAAYLNLAKLIGDVVVVASLSIREAAATVTNAAAKLLPSTSNATMRQKVSDRGLGVA